MAVCTHLEQIKFTEPPGPIAGCEECLKAGSWYWSWCYVDQLGFDLDIRDLGRGGSPRP